MDQVTAPDPEPVPARPATIHRHALATRIWHWLNAVAIFILIGSGAMIANAHKHLYWGQFGANFDRAWLDTPAFPSWFTIPGPLQSGAGPPLAPVLRAGVRVRAARLS